MTLLSGVLHHPVLHKILFQCRTCTCTAMASSNMERVSLITKGVTAGGTPFNKAKQVLSTADHFQSMLYCMPQVATTAIEGIQHG